MQVLIGGNLPPLEGINAATGWHEEGEAPILHLLLPPQQLRQRSS